MTRLIGEGMVASGHRGLLLLASLAGGEAVLHQYIYIYIYIYIWQLQILGHDLTMLPRNESWNSVQRDDSIQWKMSWIFELLQIWRVPLVETLHMCCYVDCVYSALSRNSRVFNTRTSTYMSSMYTL